MTWQNRAFHEENDEDATRPMSSAAMQYALLNSALITKRRQLETASTLLENGQEGEEAALSSAQRHAEIKRLTQEIEELQSRLKQSKRLW